MNRRELTDTASHLMAGSKGLLAMDESVPTCDKRFKEVGVPQTEENRRRYREMIVTTPKLGECISGAILFDETIRQKTNAGVPFVDIIKKAGIIPGIKVDGGAKAMAAFPGEKITEGLDGLRERLTEYYRLGARFAKWRAVITIDKGLPSTGNIEANAHALARYAALCQEAGLVPIVEPEVLMDGDHTIERCLDVTEKTLHIVFDQLNHQRVYLEGMLLKPNMILPGLACKQRSNPEEIAHKTVNCLLRNVPAAVSGIAFLSGGQPYKDATLHLNTMHQLYKDLPWTLTFSFARAVQQPALEIWKGEDKNIKAAQEILYFRTKLNNDANRGVYNYSMEK